jgi:hypothetical protein
MTSDKLTQTIVKFESTIRSAARSKIKNRQAAEHFVSRSRAALIRAIEDEIKTEKDAATVSAIKQCMRDIRERM